MGFHDFNLFSVYKAWWQQVILLTKEVGLDTMHENKIKEIRRFPLCIIYRYSRQYVFSINIATPLPAGIHLLLIPISSVQLLSRVRLSANPWITARQASLSITSSRSLLKLMPIESVMPSSHLILCRTLLLLPPIPPASGSFPMSQLFAWGGQSMGFQLQYHSFQWTPLDSSPLRWTGWISLQSKGLSRVFSYIIVQKRKFFGAQLSSQSSSHIHTWPLEKP